MRACRRDVEEGLKRFEGDGGAAGFGLCDAAVLLELGCCLGVSLLLELEPGLGSALELNREGQSERGEKGCGQPWLYAFLRSGWMVL